MVHLNDEINSCLAYILKSIYGGTTTKEHKIVIIL